MIYVNDMHPIKASLPIEVTDDDEHLAKIQYLIVITDEWITICVNDEHS